MKKINTIIVLSIFILLALTVNAAAQQCATLTPTSGTTTVTYTQDFDTLASTGTSSTVPTGFSFTESGTAANTTYAAGTGSSNTGNTYSFGDAGSTDRALGTLRSGALTSTIGGCFTNNDSHNITSIQITYDGEQWRLGALNRADRLDFQYSTDGTNWIDVDALDFSSPNNSVTGALDGNAAANRTAGITATISNLNLAPGSTFYIRYNDIDASSSDDGLAIDNFSLKATFDLVLAADAMVSGRVVDESGRGLRRVMVIIAGGDLAEPKYTMTNQFGFYRFAEISAGETYVVSVMSKNYFFTQPSKVVSINQDLTDLDFVGERMIRVSSKSR